MFVGQAHVASLAAIRTIIHAIYAHANVELSLAEAAVLNAGTLHFRLLTLRAECYHVQASSKLRFALGLILGHACAADKRHLAAFLDN